MQNKYVGDIGDFGKFLLLKSVSSGFRLGVNWCLVEDETNNNDGRFIDYLNDDSESNEYKALDSDLYEALKAIVKNGERHISKIEELKLLDSVDSKTQFFDEPRLSPLIDWHNRSLEHLECSEIIFYDPDNGLEIPSVKIDDSPSKKYLFFEEVKAAYDAGKSIIIYQHTTREGKVEEQIIKRCQQLTSRVSIPIRNMAVARFRRKQSRFYLILFQEKHREAIQNNLQNFINLLVQNSSRLVQNKRPMFIIYTCSNHSDSIELRRI